MELIDSVISEKRLIGFLTNGVKQLMSKQGFNKFNIIHECVNYAEVYFSNRPKQGELKRSIVSQVINSQLSLGNEEIHNFIK